MKSILRFPPIASALGYLIWCWMVLVARTSKWTIVGAERANAAWHAPGGLVVPAWHEQILLLPAGWSRTMRHWKRRPAPVSMLISLSRDAEPVAMAIEHLGISSIRGSKANARKKDKNKGGLRAVAQAVGQLKDGGVLCITPDGPRGPALSVGDGPILIAQRAGANIMPYAIAIKGHRRLNSWD
ncbi:MAG: DUF374 domain-containing protein, partial [Pseudomonadota bacterium]